MRLRWAIVAMFLALSAAGVGQSPDPTDVLRRTQERLLADLARLPRYTCVQTITRRYYRGSSLHTQSCSVLIKAHDERTAGLKSTGWDRLRLEVAIADGQNVFSWVGAAKFEDNNLEELAGRGPLGSGDFGTFLDAIFHNASISFDKERVTNGRRLLEYSYEMPLNLSGYRVKAGNEWVPTAYSGRLVLDPVAIDVVSLTVRSAELPYTNPACQANSEVEYRRASIHDHMVLVPSETQLNTVDRDGGEVVSETAYEHCREYSSKSRMLPMPSAENTTGPPIAAPQPANPISPDLAFDCRIVTKINSDTASAGDPIEAILRSPIHDKKNGVEIPVGSRMHGRLTRFEHRSGPTNSFRIAVQWESIEVNGQPVPLHAIPEPQSRSAYPIVPVVPVFVLADDVSPTLRFFVFRKEHLQLEQFEWRWTTVADVGNGSNAVAPFAERTLSAMQHEVDIVENEIAIEAMKGARIKVSVPAGATNVRVEGTFKTTGGDPKEIAVLLLSSDEFEKWQNQDSFSSLYDSGRTESGTVDVPLPSDAGIYYVLFSNNFPFSTPKTVQANLRLHFSR